MKTHLKNSFIIHNTVYIYMSNFVISIIMGGLKFQYIGIVIFC